MALNDDVALNGETSAEGDGASIDLRRRGAARASTLIDQGIALLADARANQGDAADRLFQSAIDRFSEASTADPGSPFPPWNWGDALRAQAEARPLPLAAPLLTAACTKYERAAGLTDGDPHLHAGVLNNWGLVLLARAKKSQGEAADLLFQSAFDKFSDASTAEPSNPLPPWNWGDALRAQAEARPLPLAAPLLTAACAKYELATGLTYGDPRSLCNVFNCWGLALVAHAKKSQGQAADVLFQSAFDRFGEASAADPRNRFPVSNWAGALKAQAETKPLSLASTLFAAACEKYELAADLIDGDPHTKSDVLDDWGLALVAHAKMSQGEAADLLFQRAFDKFSEANTTDPRNRFPPCNWGDALKAQAETKPLSLAAPLFAAADAQYERAAGLTDGNPRIKCNVLNAWGLVLVAYAKQSQGGAADQLYQRAFDKFGEASAADPSNSFPRWNWGDTLTAQAETKPLALAAPLFAAANAQYECAVGLSDGSPRTKSNVLNGWGLTLLAHARKSEGEAADDLFQRTFQKFAESSAADPSNRFPLSNWGEALTAQAETKSLPAAAALFADAIAKYQSAAGLTDGNPRTNSNVLNRWGVVLLAHAKRSQGEAADQLYQVAFAKFGEATAADPSNRLPHSNWGEALRAKGATKPLSLAAPLFAAAIAKYECAAGLSDGDPRAKYSVLNSWGLVLLAHAKKSQGEAADQLYHGAFAKFAEAEPLNADLHYASWNLGWGKRDLASRKSKDHATFLLQEAAEILQAVAARIGGAHPDYAAIRRELGWALGDLAVVCGNDADLIAHRALESFNDAERSELREDNPSLFDAALLLERREHFDRAIAQYEALAKKWPASIWAVYAHYNIADISFRQAQYEAGWEEWDTTRHLFERYLATCKKTHRAPESRTLRYYGILLHEVFGDLDGAEAVLRLGLEDGRDIVGCQIALAKLLREKSEDDPTIRGSAIAATREAIARAELLDEPPAEKAEAKAELLLLLEDYAAAEACLTPVVATGRESANLSLLCGLVHARQRRFRKAIDDLHTAHQLKPTDLSIWSNLAEAHYKAGNLDQAERHYSKILMLAPQHVDSQIGMAEVYVSLGERLGESEYYEDAIHHFSESIVLATRNCGSKRLSRSDLAAVYYSRGYARVKLRERDGISGLDQLQLALADFKECGRLNKHHIKAKRAARRLTETLNRALPAVPEKVGPFLLVVLALMMFVPAQIGFWLPNVKVRWAGETLVTAIRVIDLKLYIPVTFGSLFFVIAGLYLPRLLKLKVAGIELEKSPVDQMSVRREFGLSR